MGRDDAEAGEILGARAANRAAKLDRNARTVASASRCNNNSSMRRPMTPPGGWYLPLKVSSVLPSPRGLSSRSASRAGKSDPDPVACHVKASNVTSLWLRTGPNVTSTVLARSTGQFSGPTLTRCRSRFCFGFAQRLTEELARAAMELSDELMTRPFNDHEVLDEHFLRRPPPTMVAEMPLSQLGPKVPGRS